MPRSCVWVVGWAQFLFPPTNSLPVRNRKSYFVIESPACSVLSLSRSRRPDAFQLSVLRVNLSVMLTVIIRGNAAITVCLDEVFKSFLQDQAPFI